MTSSDATQEAERAFEEWWDVEYDKQPHVLEPEYQGCRGPCMSCAEFAYRAGDENGYRRGRAEGEQAHKESRTMVVELVGREQDLRAENARLRTQVETGAIPASDYFAMKDKLAAAEQRETRLREIVAAHHDPDSHPGDCPISAALAKEGEGK